MFCSSLRKRCEWKAVSTILLSSQQPRWQERSIESYDFAIPLPSISQSTQQDLFRFVAMSSSDLISPLTSMARIERLYHQQGGKHIGIIFLLKEDESTGNGTIAFMELQASLSSQFEIPIIPLPQISSLQQIFFAFQRQLAIKQLAAPRSSAMCTLLPYCSTNPPIPEHPRNVLSDSCISIPDLARAATSPDGQQALRQWVSGAPEGTLEDVVGFWQQEFIVE